MIDYFLILPLLISFFITLLLMPFWINKAEEVDLLWDDMNKINSPKVAGSGGLMVILGFVLGILIFIGYRVFLLKDQSFLIQILAMLVVILMLSGVGLIDDLFGWRKGGLSRRSRIIISALAAIPLMVINVGRTSMSLPFFGHVDLGIIYPLVFIPIGIVGATTTYNFLAGFNGLEAGNGILILAGLGLMAFLTGQTWLTIIALCMILALLAFLFFNFYPAKVFPGDVLTYPVGGLIAILAILGSFEKIAILFFIPVIIEFFLKVRGKLIVQSFGKPNKDGTLDLKQDKIYSLNHLTIYLLKKAGIKSTEKNVVYSIWLFQLIVIILSFIIVRGV